jgi:hypothetical protein
MLESLEFSEGCLEDVKFYRKDLIDNTIADIYEQVRITIAEELGVKAKLASWDWDTTDPNEYHRYEARCRQEFANALQRLSNFLTKTAMEKPK